MSWAWQEFGELGVLELYRIMELRQRVFVVEQRCVYLDADGRDPVCVHGTGWIGGQLVATARIVPPGHTYPTPSIGRVVTAPAARGNGLGRVLMVAAIQETSSRFPGQAITIGAQHHLAAFYATLGFVGMGDPYDDDGIIHIDMRRPPDSVGQLRN